MKRLAKSFGFTMVELMIAVGIVAILAFLGITQYQKYVEKSIQGEAKANLAALYSGEKVFFTQYRAYASELDAIGFNPSGTINYAYGFSANSFPVPAASFPPNAFGTSCYATNLSPLNCIPNARFTSSSRVVAPGSFPNSFPGGAAWIAYAASNLSGGQRPDIWSIDSGDNLINFQNGI